MPDMTRPTATRRRAWTLSVEKDRSAGYGDRVEAWIVRLRMEPGKSRIMTGYLSREDAVQRLKEIQAEAYKMLIASYERGMGRA